MKDKKFNNNGSKWIAFGPLIGTLIATVFNLSIVTCSSIGLLIGCAVYAIYQS